MDQTFIEQQRAEAKNQAILNHQAEIRALKRRIVVEEVKLMLLEPQQVLCRRFAHDGTSERLCSDIKVRKNHIFIKVRNGAFHHEWLIINHDATFRFVNASSKQGTES